VWNALVCRLCLFGALLFGSIAVYAAVSPNIWYSIGPNNDVTINMDFFLSSTCPHCHKADLFLQQVEKQEPWLQIHRYVVNTDKAALQYFYERLRSQQQSSFAVPAFFFCDSYWAGFVDGASSGETLLRALRYCRTQIMQQGTLSDAVVNTLQSGSVANQLQISPKIERQPIEFISSTAMLNAFSSCSLFGVIALFACVCLLSKHTKHAVIAGLIFILAWVGAHFVMQHYNAIVWSNYLFYLRLLGVLACIGLLAMRTYVAIVFVPFLALAVYFNQQLCLFGNAAAVRFEQWLVQQSFSNQTHIAYQIMYQAIYALPLIIFLLLFMVLGKYQRFKRYSDVCIMASYCMLTLLALMLVIAPAWLASAPISLALLVVALLYGWYMSRSRDSV